MHPDSWEFREAFSRLPTWKKWYIVAVMLKMIYIDSIPRRWFNWMAGVGR